MQHALTAEVTLRVLMLQARAQARPRRGRGRICVLLVSRVCGVCAKLG